VEKKVGGYMLEFDTTAPDPAHAAPTAQQEIERYLNRVAAGYRNLRSYAATVEFTTKAHVDTVEVVRADLFIAPPNRFRLEGRGEEGRILAIADGRQLLLSSTRPREKMRYLIKPMPRLQQALNEACSLLTGLPRPPSLADFVTGTADLRLWSGAGRIAELREGEPPEQSIGSRITIQIAGEDPIDGDAALIISINDLRVRKAEFSFRYKAFPFTVRETHSDIKVNQPVAADRFAFTPPPGAELVHDLGEGDEADFKFSVPGRR
jgi:hypothetical protein